MKLLLVPTCTLALFCASVQASRLSEHIASPELKAKMQEVYGARAIQRAEAFRACSRPERAPRISRSWNWSITTSTI